MRPFPFWTRGEVAIPFGRPVRVALMPQAVANFLESVGYRVSELADNKVSFRGPAKFRFAPGYWTQLTSGRVRVEANGQTVRLTYDLSFLFHNLLLLLVGGILLFVLVLLEERHTILTSIAYAVLLLTGHLFSVAWATRTFGNRARNYLLENLIRYV
ncbi:MAG: hypothetical protein AMXMBFR36_25960 [Acidobacteriota bacterium]